MQDAIMDMVELRRVVSEIFGYFSETPSTRSYSKDSILSVIDTDWSVEDDKLLARHWIVDPEPVIEAFCFPPTWSNRESWRNLFQSAYPVSAEDGLKTALWTARTASKIIVEEENGVRVLRSIETDPVVKPSSKKWHPELPPVKRKKKVDHTPSFFGSDYV